MIKLLKKINRRIIDLFEKIGRQRDKEKKSPKAVVLTYHRVDELTHDPLMLAVTPWHFDDQLKKLKENFDIITVKELVKRLSSRTLKGDELAITLDDGYKDNLTNALPIARAHHIPITIFVTSGITDPDFSFPWDKEYGNGKSAYLNQEELDVLALDPLVTIGAHTITHPRLRTLSENEQRKEIASSKASYFAYPFGGLLDFNSASKKIAKESGFEAAFATRDRIITEDSDLYSLPRINVRDWSGDELLDRVRQYL